MEARKIYQLCLTAIVLGTTFVSSDAQAADAVNWRVTVDLAKVEAAQSGKLILLHFWTPSCGPCRKLDSEVFSQPQIGELMEQNFIPVKVNAELSPALANSYNITRVPTDVVITSQGNVIAVLRCPMNPAAYGTQLLNLAQSYRQNSVPGNTSFQPPVQSAYAGLKVGQYQGAASSAAPATNQAVQPGQQAQPVASMASRPQVTNNRYATAPAGAVSPAQVASPASAPTVYSNRYAATQPVVAAQQAATPPIAAQAPAAAATTNPSNANANRYVAATPAVPMVATQQVATPPVATQPVQPPVAAVVNSSPVASVTPGAANMQQAAQSPALAGSAPLAFEGYCSVTLKQMHKWVMGNSQFGATHRGRTYLFVGDQQRQQFLANPDSFSPVFSGLDPVKMLEENLTVEGSRKFGYEYRGAFYLFGSREAMQKFASQPDHYAAGVRQAMTRMDASAGGTIRR